MSSDKATLVVKAIYYAAAALKPVSAPVFLTCNYTTRVPVRRPKALHASIRQLCFEKKYTGRMEGRSCSASRKSDMLRTPSSAVPIAQVDRAALSLLTFYQPGSCPPLSDREKAGDACE